MPDEYAKVPGVEDPADPPSITLPARSEPYLIKVGAYYLEVVATDGTPTDPWGEDPIGVDADGFDDGY
jgi:hypothetical protein